LEQDQVWEIVDLENLDLDHKQMVAVVLPDLAHAVLLGTDYILLRPVRAKLEKAVALAKLQDALDIHAPLLAAAMLVAASQPSFDDPAPVGATFVVVPQQFFDNEVPVDAMPHVGAPLALDTPVLACASALAAIAFGDDTLAPAVVFVVTS
jgi:hypothetical protein